MKKYLLYVTVLVFFFSGCGKDDSEPNVALRETFKGEELQLMASRKSGNSEWTALSGISVSISEDGFFFTLNQNNGNACEGSVDWRSENGKPKAYFKGENDTCSFDITIIDYDSNHLVGELSWEENLQEWLLVSGTDNIKGLVVDRVGNPLLGARVVVKAFHEKIGVLETDEFGYFGFNSQTPGFENLEGANNIVVYKEGFEDGRREVSPGAQYFMVLDEGLSGLNEGIVYGYVSDADGGEPLAGITVSYGDGSDVVYTNSEGYYEISVPTSENSVYAYGESHEKKTNSVSVEMQTDVQVNFSLLRSGSSMTGTVLNIDAVGVGDVRVTCKDRNGAIVDTYSTTSDGAFVFEHLKDGVYLVSVSVSGMQFIPAQQLVAVLGSDVSGVMFKGIANGKTGIGGNVNHAIDGSPLGGVLVICGSSSAVTDSNGYFVMEIEGSGSMAVTVAKDGFDPRYLQVPITSGQLVYITLSLSPTP
ncbi:carboxypeptidase regulatory-like domain-containing protein [Marinilabilia sp.]|uniref:carboxypeptidase regulatory-like domain-containing protein n=1 Tax=Marinilabilia sp. TaxID=2021252 RepID=UPI0025B8B1E4|nr:carboxypeptidase regulatory-like domain-containing protein [Marinilabilia sp.]